VREWHSTLIRRLDALVSSWKHEATGYDALAVAADPVLAEHCSTIANAAEQLRHHIERAKESENIAMERLAAQLRDIDADSRKAAHEMLATVSPADRLALLVQQSEVAALVDVAATAMRQWRGGLRRAAQDQGDRPHRKRRGRRSTSLPRGGGRPGPVARSEEGANRCLTGSSGP
jgi:hypothetical protein